MPKARLIALATLGALSVAIPAGAQLPQKAAPQGLALTAASASGGRKLTTQMRGSFSAHKMFAEFRRRSGNYFDAPFTINRAFADADDANIQAAVTAKLKGVPVRGIATVTMKEDVGQCSLVFDSASSFAKMYASTAKRTGSAHKVVPVTLTPQTAPDGSARISLPPGYRIVDSYKGTMDITGPHGAIMALGGYCLGTTHQAAPYFPGVAPLDFNDPVRAFQDYCTFVNRKAGVSANIKVIDSRPVEGWTTGHAALIRYNIQSGGKSMEAFGLFSIAVTGENQAMFYLSYFGAPTATYRSQFPGMLRAWGTWNIDPSVFQERMTAAANTMRGMSDIIASTYANTQLTNDRVHEAWSDVIRDQGTWANPDTGTHYKVSNALTNGGGIPMIDGTPLQPVPLGEL